MAAWAAAAPLRPMLNAQARGLAMARTRAKAKGRSDSGSYFPASPQTPEMRGLHQSERFGTQGTAASGLASTARTTATCQQPSPMSDPRRSSSTLAAAIVELQQRNLIICTRTGRFMRPGGRCFPVRPDVASDKRLPGQRPGVPAHRDCTARTEP